MSTTPRRFQLSMRQRDARIALLFVAPAITIILLVTLQPILSTLYLSLFESQLGRFSVNVFRGLGNYIDLLKSPVFWSTIRRTLHFTLLSVGRELVLGIAVAQLIASHPPGWKFLRTSLIIPWAVPTIVTGMMWRWIYNADYGSLNGLLSQLGLIKQYIPWLIQPTRAM
ncbi:MAG: sugar ABC transporter permease, partial [Anaerolineales bacterium]|nr:sugar ABC transporter permease [Anaerolineales bacterium]